MTTALKFKVGDHVRVLLTSETTTSQHACVGKTFVIVHISEPDGAVPLNSIFSSPLYYLDVPKDINPVFLEDELRLAVAEELIEDYRYGR